MYEGSSSRRVKSMWGVTANTLSQLVGEDVLCTQGVFWLMVEEKSKQSLFVLYTVTEFSIFI